MSGHSKWSTIKRKKAVIDAKRGKAFSKLTKEITVAARGGGDPASNARLRLLIEKAREINMPMDNIGRAIKRGTGELPGVHYESHHYEGYGPHGIAVIVEALTDNKNRTVADVRRIFTSTGGSLGENNTVSWMFSKMGVIIATGTGTTEDDLLDKLIEHDIKDISHHEDTFTITCEPKALEDVKKIVATTGLTIESADVELVAQNSVTLQGPEAERAYEFLDELEALDDVQNVYSNLA